MPARYFEDFSTGDIIAGGQEYHVTKEEIIEFARKWDPHLFHTDEEAAKDSLFGGITAPATLVLAIASWLWHTADDRPALVAGLGWEEVRFLGPVRPGDRLSISFRCTDKRPSDSRPDFGILSSEVTVKNQDGSPVLVLVDSYLVKRRGR